MYKRLYGAVLLPFVLAIVAGCGPQAPPKAEGGKGKGAQLAESKPAGAAKKVHDHSGWWCDEHGVPEEICGQCNAKYAAECQKKGDWCKKHDRPDSQCFICHPELEAKFAAQYETKYGEKPPKRTEEESSPKEESEK